MSISRLQDDLLKEFKEEKAMVFEQIKVLDPMATALRKPAAQRLIGKGVLIFFEVLCYLVSIGSIAFAIVMHRIYPFSVLHDMLDNTKSIVNIAVIHISYLHFAVYGMVAVAAILFYVIARMCRKMRLKNDILHAAGKDIKLIVSQYLQRRAAIEAIEQRHLLELPGEYYEPQDVNSILNPGYGE